MLVFERYLRNGRDYFGKSIGVGSKRIVLLLNNNSEEYLRFDNRTGKFSKADSGNGEDLYVVSVDEGADITFEVPPEGLLFILYK